MFLQKNKKYFGVLLFPIILVLPFPLIVDSIALTIALLNIVFAGIVQNSLRIKDWFKEGKILLGFGLFIFLLDSISETFREGELQFLVRESRVALLLVPVIIVLARDKIKEIWNATSTGLIIGVLLYILYAYFFLFIFYETQSNRAFELNHYLIYDLYNYLPGAYHHTYLGMYFTFSIILALEFYRTSGKKFWLFLVVFVFFNQIFMGGKINLILSALYLVFCFPYKSFTKTKGLIFAPVFLLTVLSVAIYFVFRSELWKTIKFSFENRLASWECSWKIFLEHWKAGIGYGGINEYLFPCVGSDALSSHNQYLEELVHYGFLGFWLPVFLIIILSISRGHRIYMQFLIMIIVIALSENILSLQRGILFFALINTILYFFALYEKNKGLSFDDSP